jgi:predicted nucleic acid-binding protein
MKSKVKNRYIIDTNIYGLLLSPRFPQLNKFINTLEIDDYIVSAFVLAELDVLRHTSSLPKLMNLLYTLENSEVVWFDQKDLKFFSRLKYILGTKNIKNRTIDCFIASQCLAQNCTLITTNKKDFENIPGLKTKFFDQKNSRWL